MRSTIRGQALVLFALFLLVLLGAAAIGVDYANWLLIDRQLQNVADHAALAGASQFSQDFASSSCSGGSGSTQCNNARTQAWAALNQQLALGLDDTAIGSLGARNSSSTGDTFGTLKDGTRVDFTDRIWVSTPPPASSEYTGLGGLYKSSYGIVFVRVDQPTRSFLGGVFGISVRNRIGWATAGILPEDFALQVYCRNNIAPENGVCADGGTSLGIDGGGGITLARGDIGSSNSLQVTQQTGQGVITKAGNVFLVNGTCGSSSWNCPPATLGGISDGSGTPKNAFYIPPIPVTYYALPTGTGTSWNDTTQPNSNCSTASVSSPCIPIPATSNYSSNGIDWACSTVSGSTNQCGTPVVVTSSGVSTVTCTSHGAATQDMRPNGDDSFAPSSGNVWNTQGGSGGSIMYNRINDASVDPSGSVPNPPTGPTTLTGAPSSFVYTKDGTTGTSTYRVTLSSPNGTPQIPGNVYVRWTLFGVTKSGSSEVVSSPGGTISVSAQLQEKVGGTWVNRGAADTETPTGTVMEYQTTARTDVSTITNPNALGILFTITTTGAAPTGGVGISWAEAWLDQAPVPPPPPTVPPGQYRSIVIPDGGCAVMDPTGYESGGLSQYQMPGIYYFRDSTGGGQNATISLGVGSVLIGDGVTLVFDSNWPNPSGSGGSASAHGIEMGSNAALVINSAISTTSGSTCPAGTATTTYNPSTPLPALADNAVCAAWEIDPTNPANGMSSWGGACSTACSLDRTTAYASGLNSSWRGVTLYFKPKTNGSTNSSSYTVLGRFAMGGNVAGISYRGILYAPYDDVEMSGANGFDTVGMVLAWSAKFNGGSASITLDYPYARITAPPYLLEPSVQQ